MLIVVMETILCYVDSVMKNSKCDRQFRIYDSLLIINIKIIDYACERESEV